MVIWPVYKTAELPNGTILKLIHRDHVKNVIALVADGETLVLDGGPEGWFTPGSRVHGPALATQDLALALDGRPAAWLVVWVP